MADIVKNEPQALTPEVVGIYAPYERAIIAVLELIGKIVDGQPPEVREKLWRLHLDDMIKWRAFIEKIGGIFPKLEPPK